MAVNAHSGALALNVATGNQSVSGLGFQPKLVILQSTPDTANIVTAIANSHWSYGAFDGTNKTVQASNDRNGISTSDNRKYADITNTIYVADPPGTMTPDYIATGVSLDADGFTINITNAPPINYRFGYWALGGSDVTNVKVGTFGSKGSTGSQGITGVGFQPDLIIIFSSGTFGGMPVNLGEGINGIGFANGLLTANQYAMGSYSADGTTSAIGTISAHNTGYVVYLPMTNTFVSLQATLTSFDADGFTLNWVTHPVLANVNMSYIAIKGTVDFKSKVGVAILPVFTGGKTIVTGIGFDPKCGLFASACFQALGTTTAGVHTSFGWADTLKNMFMTGQTARFFGGSMNSFHTSHDLRIHRYNLYSSGGSLLEEASIGSWDTNGFTIYGDKSAGGGASRMGYLVINAQGLIPPPVTTKKDFGFII